ncbi:MAG TPA: ABC transporter permease [Chloroflexi bacterium]|nr:ABC transporter permease [Chloroflexota bacterium]
MATTQVTWEVFEDKAERAPLTPTQVAWRRFRRHKMAMAGVIILTLILLYVTVGAFFYTEAYANYNDLSIRFSPPSWEHPFGTDGTGRDIMARTIYGGQISVLIGLCAVMVSMTSGVLVGALSGYYGGFLDAALMRVTEAMLNIPQLFLLIILSKFLGGKVPTFNLLGRTLSGSVVIIVVVIGLTSWMYLARIVRANFLSLKEQEFVMAARCIGVRNRNIIFEHILPNSIAPIVVAATLGVASAIINEAYVSFLGVGVQAPTATWGNMLDQAYHHLETRPWMWFFPGMLILLTVLGINFVGDGLRDALDPRALAQSE